MKKNNNPEEQQTEVSKSRIRHLKYCFCQTDTPQNRKTANPFPIGCFRLDS